MRVSDAVVVACSQPGEQRWGRFQFPSISRLPDGELLVAVHDADDAVAGYGDPVRRYVSTDEGRTWRSPGGGMPPDTGPHGICAKLHRGEHLMLSASAPFDVGAAGLTLPKPVGDAIAYRSHPRYAVAECPEPVRDHVTRLPAWRWTPQRREWREERVGYGFPGQLCWTVGGEARVPHTWFENPPVLLGDEVLYVDYRTPLARVDGSAPDGYTCVLMASRDNARSFGPRALVASGRVYEPTLIDTAEGELVCVIRGADQQQRPMLITRSHDRGRSWEDPRELFGFGVFPSLARLGDGTLLLAFGRPGVWLSASRDGGRTWSDPDPVIAGDAAALMAHTCGYTGLLAVDDREALLVHSDFQRRDAAGRRRKAIAVRRIAA